MLDRNFYRVLILVVLLTGAGQMTNTIYVPALSDIAQTMEVRTGLMQAVVACYLIPYGLLQFVFGPASDRWGRRPVILIGLTVFVTGSLIAATSINFYMLIAGSLLQGSGIAVAGVMARTVMKDLYTGERLQISNSYMSMALILAPLLAPLIGGLFATAHHWRGIFIFLAIYGVIVFGLQWFYFSETNQHKGARGNILQRYKTVLSSKIFIINLLLLIIANGGIAVFEVSSGALFTSVLELSPAMASLYFIIPLPFYIFGSFATSKLIKYISLDIMLAISCVILLFSGLMMVLLYFSSGISLLAIIVPGSIYFLGCGMIFPTATTRAIEIFPNIAGTAGALLGGMQNLGAGVLTATASLFPLRNQLPLAVLMSSLAAMALIAIIMSMPRSTMNMRTRLNTFLKPWR